MGRHRRRRGPAPLLPLWAAVPTSAVGALALDGAFPDLGWWPLAFVGVCFALVSLIGRSAGGAFLVGTVYGVVFVAVDVVWTARYLGPLPWAALSVFEGLLMGAGAILITFAFRWTSARRGIRLWVLPLLVAGLWTTREQVLGSWPYGGFPWGRVGMSQADGPLAEVASWVGVSGLTFFVVACSAGLIELVRTGGGVRRAVPLAVVAVALVVLPAFPTTPAGELTVGAVQGNGPAGYFDQRERAAVLRAQVAASAPLEGEDLDLVVWPEGGVDADPIGGAATGAVLSDVSARLGAPLLMNTVTARDGLLFNTSLVWTADGPAPGGYDKIHPVPFGEYVPDRWFFRPFAPELIDLIAREYTPGVREPWVDVAGTIVALAICFDVIYDEVVWDGVRAGATFSVYQTNNADFRDTDENLQQVSIARMRAIETGRSVVNVSTVGTSEVIAPDGSVLVGIPADEVGAVVAAVPLRTGLTPAVAAGPWIRLVLWTVPLIGLAVSYVRFRTRSRTASNR